MSAWGPDEVRAALRLDPHPTCGYVRVSFVSGISVAADGLPDPFADARPAGSALYFLVTRDAPVRLHRIRNDQLYHRYLGDALEVLLLYTDGTHRIGVVGPDLKCGHQLQLFIPGGTFHTARLLAGGRWFLGASTEWPGVIPADVETGSPAALAASHPAAASLIEEFTG